MDEFLFYEVWENINWFISDYITNGKGLQQLICIVKLLASFLLSAFYCFCVIIFISTISVNKDEYRKITDREELIWFELIKLRQYYGY